MTEDLSQMPMDWERALAVVAHPDDMEFGAASAVASWTAHGKSVSYVLATRGEAGIDGLAPEQAAPVREAEQRASAAIVGVKTVEFLGFGDGVIEYGLPLRRDIAAAIRRHRPELVISFNHHEYFTSGRLNTPDHRHVGRAVLDAVGDAGNRWIFPDSELDPWQGVRYLAVANSPNPTHAVDVTDSLEAGIDSLQAHRAYIEGLNMPGFDVRGAFTTIARQTGERFGGRPAVSFEMLPC
ncbi:PIG-L deacetylase family protein [Streptomyces sp. NPDC048441]|uniref:PIG-L deacetylase family protein n=1 Tax=Streptomyces sp. NPDC048441 TaxID=3365552 RepID=UPI003717116C